MPPDGELPSPVSASGKCTVLLFHPSRAFRNLHGEPLKAAVTWYVTLFLASLFLSAVVTSFWYNYEATAYPFGYHTPFLSMLAFVIISLLVLFTIGFLILALIIHILVYICGGRAGTGRTLAVLLYAATPVLLALFAMVAVLLFQVAAGMVIIIAFALWSVILAVAGFREFHGLSTARAALPFVLPAVFVIALLAAVFVIAMFQGPCGGGMCNYVASATAACTGENITVTYQGGPDAYMLTKISAYDTDPATVRTMGGQGGVLPVGSVLVLEGPFFSPAHVIAFAYYQDGTQQVILDTFLKCGSGPAKTATPATPATTRPVTAAAGNPAVTGTPAGTLAVTGTVLQATATTGAKAATVVPAAAGNPEGLLVWYDFEDDFMTTGTVADRSGSGRDAKVTGTVKAGDGIGGTKGIAFTGAGYLLAPDNPAAGRKNVTFSFWFRTGSPANNYKFASAAEWYGGPGTGWTMATHRPEFWADDGTDDLLVPAQQNADNHFAPGTWTHEAVVYDGATMKEYTDGALINDWQARGVAMSPGVPMAVGGWPQFAGYNYAGELDEFRIYDRALPAEEIAGMYQAGRG